MYLQLPRSDHLIILLGGARAGPNLFWHLVAWLPPLSLCRPIWMSAACPKQLASTAFTRQQQPTRFPAHLPMRSVIIPEHSFVWVTRDHVWATRDQTHWGRRDVWLLCSVGRGSSVAPAEVLPRGQKAGAGVRAADARCAMAVGLMLEHGAPRANCCTKRAPTDGRTALTTS